MKTTDPIPLDLRRYPRWVFRLPGQKIPRCVDTGDCAFRSGRPRADSYATYHSAVRRDPKHLGFDIDSPFLGVDLDKVLEYPIIEGSRKRVLTARGRELLSALPYTYAEVSPSGHGMHLWYRVSPKDHRTLPNSAIGDHIEIYSRLRWFTVTGPMSSHPSPVRKLALEQALTIFALGSSRPKPSVRHLQRRNRKRSGKQQEFPTGIWSPAAIGAFLKFNEVEFRRYRDHEFRVRCPGTIGWSDGVTHDDDELNGNASCVAVLKGWPAFYCHHAKCAKKRWLDFLEYYDPQHSFDIDSWLLDRVRRSKRGAR